MTLITSIDSWWRKVLVRRALIARGLVLIAVLCMILSAYFFRPQLESLAHYRPTPGPRDYYDPLAPWCFLIGSLALVAALILFPRAAAVANPRRIPAKLDALSPDWAWRLIIPAALALLVVAETNGRLLKLQEIWGLSPPIQFVLLIAGIALVIIALAGVGWLRKPASARLKAVEDEARSRMPRSAPIQPAAESRWRFRAEIAFVGLITLAALVIRCWNLGDSVRVMVDEGHFALGVTYFWAFPDVRLLEPMPTSASFPFIFSYGQAGMVEVFGRNFFGLRALSALLGALTIPALYLLARELFDRRTALLAALVLLTFPPQVHYSRLALNNIADPFFGTLALALLARGLRTRRRIEYVLAGVSLGMTQYFYEGGRLLYPALIAAWMTGGLIFWRPRPSVRGLLLLAVAFVLVAAPVYYTLIGSDFPLTDRLDKTEYSDQYWQYNREPDNLSTRIDHFRHSLMHYINAPENTIYNYYLYYGGKHPLIFPAVVPAFLLGLILSAWCWRTPRVLLIGWVLATSAGNAMLVESAVTARYVVVFPGIALLIAVGIFETLRLLWLPRWPDRWRVLPALLLVGAITAGQGSYYFGPFLDLFNREVRMHVTYDVEDALLRSTTFPEQTQIFMVGQPLLPESDAQRLLNFLVDDRKVFVFTPDLFATLDPDTLRRDIDLAFYFGESDTATRERLEAAFGPRLLRYSPYDVPQDKAMVLFYVPALSGPPPVG